MMNRRQALTIAATAAIAITAGVTAMAANLGILDNADSNIEQIGTLDSNNVAELIRVNSTAVSPEVVGGDGADHGYDESYDESDDDKTHDDDENHDDDKYKSEDRDHHGSDHDDD